MKRVYTWLGSHVHKPYAIWIFALLVFIEGFFIMPVSTMLTFFCLENRKKSYFYAIIATTMSLIGALAGYFIGFLLWKYFGQKFIYYFLSPDSFDYIVEQYKKYQAATIFSVALTPLPFKALTLTAGFCNLPLGKFLLYCFIGRGAKFFCIATAIFIWGNHVKYYIDKYFYYLFALFIALMIFTWKILH